MKNSKYAWVIGLIITLLIILVPIAIFGPKAEATPDNPQAHLPAPRAHTDHSQLLKGPYENASDVTKLFNRINIPR